MALIIYHNAIISYSGCVVFNIGGGEVITLTSNAANAA